MSEVSRLDEIIQDISKFSPVLIMGDAVKDFKKRYQNPIRTVRNTDDVRELVAYYTSIRNLNVPLVVDDLSFLNEKGTFLLLKLVEESTFPVVLLSTFDKVSAIILSRVKTVIKYHNQKVSSEFLPPSKGYERLEESLSEDSHYYDRIRMVAKLSPVIYYLEQQIGRVRNKRKIIEILG